MHIPSQRLQVQAKQKGSECGRGHGSASGGQLSSLPRQLEANL